MLLVDNNTKAFLELVKAGLWETDARLSPFKEVDFEKVFILAQEQSVVGLVAAGFEHVVDVKIPQEVALNLAGEVLQLEQQNLAMNSYVAKLIEKLRIADVYTLLVKGQGIALCYERPLWRSCGDVDLLLSDENYQKAKDLLLPLASSSEKEYSSFKHLSMIIDDFEVELHGTLHTRLSSRIDKEIDKVQADVFYNGSVRSWQNDKTLVFLPAVNNDVIFLITHILHHFYVEGIGLRQFCDWCRFLWTNQSEIDVQLLENRLSKMGLLTEWKTFAALAVDWLGISPETMPLYSSNVKWSHKAEYVLSYLIECGNFGHNREITIAKSYWGEKMRSTFRKIRDFGCHTRAFPLDSVRFFFGFLKDGIGQAARGE